MAFSEQLKKGSFQLMLKTLLQHNVPEKKVFAIANAAQDYTFLDARSKEEFEVSHIANARYVGYDDFDVHAVKDLATDTPIIVYCSVGYRSEKVAQQLIRAGYTNTFNLLGGIFEWKNQGQKVYRGDKETEQVHVYDKVWGVWLLNGEKTY